MNNYPYATNNYGFGYGVSRPQARNTQPLTQDQIAMLRQNSNAFDMKIDQEDILRASCTHKEKNGQPALISHDDGTYECTICHARFHMPEIGKEDVEKAVAVISDILQTCKTIYLDIPEELASHYFQMLPLLEKLPGLWERSAHNFSLYEGTATVGVNQMGPGYSGFAAMQNLLANPYSGYGYNNGYNGYGYQPAPQQPMPAAQGYGYQQPNIYGQPMNPTYGAPVDPSNNPMAYGVPGTVPAPAPGVMPGVPAPAPVQGAPAATDTVAPASAEVVQQQVFNV